MTWDNRDVLPAHGPAARAVPGGQTFNRERSPAVPGDAYPQPRDGRAHSSGLVATRFPRYQSNTITLAASTAFQEVIRFSGRPDNIDLSASAAGVEYRFRNRGETVTDSIRAPGTAFHDTNLNKEIVEARDPTGTGGQTVTAHGTWVDAPTS